MSMCAVWVGPCEDGKLVGQPSVPSRYSRVADNTNDPGCAFVLFATRKKAQQ